MLKNHGPFRRQGVEKYISQLSRPRDKPIYDSTVTAILSKAGFSIPEDPASIYEPSQLWEQLSKYCEEDVFSEDEYVSAAVKAAYQAFGFRQGLIKLDTLKSEIDFINAIKMEKYAGVYFQTKGEAWPRAWTRSHDISISLKQPNPCLAGVRTQRGNKTRLVWMYPLDMTILEAKFASPLIENFKNIRSPMPYARKRFELGARVDYTLIERNRVALDFSKFDSSVSSKLIKICFRILKTWFDLTKDEESIWKKVVDYFIRTPIVMIDGNLYTGKIKGVPSGSFFTQLVDSISNFIIIYAAMLRSNMKPNFERIHILGDDSIFSTNSDVSLLELKTYFLKLGFKLNVEKSQVKRDDEPIHFLGFDWYKGVSYRDINKIISSLSQPETWRNRNIVKSQEIARAYRLIVEMSTLGANLYEISQAVTGFNPRDLNFYRPEGVSSSGYIQYQKEYHPNKIFHNISVGLWV